MEDSVKKKFTAMLEFQKKDIELRKMNSLINRDQALLDMNKHERVFNEAKQTLDDCEQQASDIVNAYAELQRYVEENTALLEALENSEAESDEELEQRIKKLDSLKSKFISAEKKARNMDERSREVCKSRAAAVTAGKSAKQQFNDAKAKHNQLLNSKAEEFKKLKAELAALRETLDDDLYNEYNKLIKEKKFPPVVPARADERKGMFNCGGCGLGLPQQGNAYLRDRGWCRCDNCRRIIVKFD